MYSDTLEPQQNPQVPYEVVPLLSVIHCRTFAAEAATASMGMDLIHVMNFVPFVGGKSLIGHGFPLNGSNTATVNPAVERRSAT